MRRYLIVGHRTLGGAHLIEHLQSLRAAQPDCELHVLVPEHVGPGWSDFEIGAEAQARLDEMLGRLAAMGLSASGEVGAPDPVAAATAVLEREAADAFDAIVLSTLPQQYSKWWNVADDLRDAFPTVPLTHLVAARAFVP